MVEKMDGYERLGNIIGVILSVAAYGMVAYPLFKWWLE